MNLTINLISEIFSFIIQLFLAIASAVMYVLFSAFSYILKFVNFITEKLHINTSIGNIIFAIFLITMFYYLGKGVSFLVNKKHEKKRKSKYERLIRTYDYSSYPKRSLSSVAKYSSSTGEKPRNYDSGAQMNSNFEFERMNQERINREFRDECQRFHDEMVRTQSEIFSQNQEQFNHDTDTFNQVSNDSFDSFNSSFNDFNSSVNENNFQNFNDMNNNNF